MTRDKVARTTFNKARHRARQLQEMANDLRHLPAPRWRWRLIAFTLDRLARLMVAERGH